MKAYVIGRLLVYVFLIMRELSIHSCSFYAR